MPVSTIIYDQPQRLWKFLGFFQPNNLRMLHIIIVIMVVIQIVLGYFSTQYAPHRSITSFITSIHIVFGCMLASIAGYFIACCFVQRGLHHYYPYLWGDFFQLQQDIRKTMRLQAVPPRPQGLAVSVQGLGFGALILAAFSGIVWFVLWYNGVAEAIWAKHMHTIAAMLVLIYALGHGSMAILHFIMWQYKVLHR